MVSSGFSLAREVRWGIRSYSSVRVGGCAPLEIFGASYSGFDSATLHQCGLWPRQHHSGLAQAVGHASRLCLSSQNSVLALLLFINQVHGVCAYRASKQTYRPISGCGPPPFIAHTCHCFPLSPTVRCPRLVSPGAVKTVPLGQDPWTNYQLLRPNPGPRVQGKAVASRLMRPWTYWPRVSSWALPQVQSQLMPRPRCHHSGTLTCE